MPGYQVRPGTRTRGRAAVVSTVVSMNPVGSVQLPSASRRPRDVAAVDVDERASSATCPTGCRTVKVPAPGRAPLPLRTRARHRCSYYCGCPRLRGRRRCAQPRSSSTSRRSYFDKRQGTRRGTAAGGGGLAFRIRAALSMSNIWHWRRNGHVVLPGCWTAAATTRTNRFSIAWASVAAGAHAVVGATRDVRDYGASTMMISARRTCAAAASSPRFQSGDAQASAARRRPGVHGCVPGVVA